MKASCEDEKVKEEEKCKVESRSKHNDKKSSCSPIPKVLPKKDKTVIDLTLESTTESKPNHTHHTNAKELTSEQKAIVDLALAPHSIPPKGSVIRVTSGAGTGKTTVIEAFAKRLKELGHSHIVYLTFNKSAVLDAQSRVGKFANCRTIHSAAFSVLHLVGSATCLLNELELELLVKREFRKDILAFVGARGGTLRVEKLIAHFIVRTLIRFLHSGDSEETGFDPNGWNTTYFPAKKWHEGTLKTPCPLEVDFGDFYVRMARRLFHRIRPKQPGNMLTTYDAVMKECQVLGLYLTQATALLIDESQDCNECQIKWLLGHRPGRQIVFVGDAVQTIYGFRGSSSKYLLDVSDCYDAQLTKSFRFGPRIAAAANLILFAKENSPQRDWKPYRLTGAAPIPGNVLTTGHAAKLAKLRRRTIIAWTNISLMYEVLQNYLDRVETLKIAIVGDGPNSGVGKWKRVCKQIGELADLFCSEKPRMLSLRGFEDDGFLSYDGFQDLVLEREMNDYLPHVNIISKFGSETQSKVRLFESMVLNKCVPASQADLILCTVHASKGLEWDTVQVLDDLITLADFRFDSVSQDPVFQTAMEVKPCSCHEDVPAQFSFHSRGDEVNLWYVAVTRAKRNLIVPERLLDLLVTMDTIPRLLIEEGIRFPVPLPVFRQPCPGSRKISKICDLQLKRLAMLDNLYRAEIRQSGVQLDILGYEPEASYAKYLQIIRNQQDASNNQTPQQQQNADSNNQTERAPTNVKPETNRVKFERLACFGESKNRKKEQAPKNVKLETNRVKLEGPTSFGEGKKVTSQSESPPCKRSCLEASS